MSDPLVWEPRATSTQPAPKSPGLGTTPRLGIGENQTHRSQGSLSSRSVVGPVRSNDLRPTGISTTADENGVLDIFDIVEPVRSNDLRPTGMLTTENASRLLDDLGCDGTPDNFDFDGLEF